MEMRGVGGKERRAGIYHGKQSGVREVSGTERDAHSEYGVGGAACADRVTEKEGRTTAGS